MCIGILLRVFVYSAGYDTVRFRVHAPKVLEIYPELGSVVPYGYRSAPACGVGTRVKIYRDPTVPKAGHELGQSEPVVCLCIVERYPSATVALPYFAGYQYQVADTALRRSTYEVL